MAKIIAFVVITFLFFLAVYIYGMRDNWMSIFYLVLSYLGFILVTLYEIGRIEIERQENENRNNREQDL